MRFLSFLLTVAVFVSAPAPVVRGANPAPDFNREVRPILSDKCMHCHGPDEAARKGKLRLDTADGVAKIIKPGHALESEFYKRLLTTDPDLQMPPPESPITKQLTPREIATLREWLQAGAPYSTHWAFEAPRQAPPPASPDPAWNKNPVDRFIHARLLKEGLQPAPEADRATLIRRVTLDLTGTLPTLGEVDAFCATPARMPTNGSLIASSPRRITASAWPSPGWTSPATAIRACITPTARATCGAGATGSSALTTAISRSINSPWIKSPATSSPRPRSIRRSPRASTAITPPPTRAASSPRKHASITSWTA